MTKKEFELSQIGPFYRNPELCGTYKTMDGIKCANITGDGKMCVVGKNLLDEVREKYPISPIEDIFLDKEYDQSAIFKPEAVGKLSEDEWTELQDIHDSIALGKNIVIGENLEFTLEELKAYAEALPLN